MMSSRIWPALAADQRILRAAGRQPAGVVGGEPLDQRRASDATHEQAAHVRQIEDADAGPHGQVLGPNARRVLDGHVPAAEVHHAGSGGEMAIVEGGPEERSSCRGITCHTAAS